MTPQPPFSGLLEAARVAVAEARHELRIYQAQVDYCRAETEAAIATAFDLGKNAEERTRTLTIHLEGAPAATDPDWIGVYQDTRTKEFKAQLALDRATAALETLRDQRRDYENDLRERELTERELVEWNAREATGL